MELHEIDIHNHIMGISIISSVVFFGLSFVVYKIIKKKDE